MENIDIYSDRLIKYINHWIERFNLKPDSGFAISEKSINHFKNKQLKQALNELVKRGKGYLLTEDFCYYLVYEAFKSVDYQGDLIKLLNKIYKADDNELIKILNKYIFYVCFGDIYKFDKQENYVNLMSQEDLDMFNTCMKCIHSMYQTGVRAFESDILTEILFNIYGYCVIHHQKDKFDKLVSKYFINPRQTIDHFINNGFMNKDYELKENFNDFIYQDMNRERNPIVIK